MKKTVFVLFAIVAVMFTLSSCTPENSDDTDTLLGEKLGSLIAGQWSAYCWDPRWIVIVDFSASGTYTSRQYYVEGNSEINGSEVSGDNMEDEGVFTGRWIISGNNVRISIVIFHQSLQHIYRHFIVFNINIFNYGINCRN